MSWMLSMSEIDRVLDRMVDNLLAYNEIPFLDDVQFIWRRGWSIENVTDPEDMDPLRYALKACILERLAELWSQPPRNMDTRPPGWCESVPAVEEEFNVISEEYRAYFANDLRSSVFARRNIFAPREFMFFL